MADATLLWIRRELRFADHPALSAALARGAPVVPVFICDAVEAGVGGAANRWRLRAGLDQFDEDLRAIGGRLIVREGDAAEELIDLAKAVGADRVHRTRLYAPDEIARDAAADAALARAGLTVRVFGGRLLREPEALAPATAPFYKVYTPFWKAFRAAEPPAPPLPAPTAWTAPSTWPRSVGVAALSLGRDMRRGEPIVAARVEVGEKAALARLHAFLEGAASGYGDARDRLDRDATSGLSHHLAVGEISPRTVWTETEQAMIDRSAGVGSGFETFLKEIVWREFAHVLLAHTPHIATRNWRPEWDAFPWRTAESAREAVAAWTRGRTGVDVIDAAMRELYVTGRMHNRARMLTASYLTKHLMVDWRVGEAWFRDCLVDWDAASNAMGWQWSAGSGPDAAPFFRIFNPETQAEKFDPRGAYVRRWLPQSGRQLRLGDAPSDDALAFYDACPRAWGLSPDDLSPAPLIGLKAGRERALEAYKSMREPAA